MGLFEKDRLIADRAEFMEVLLRLRRGHLLTQIGDNALGCVLDGTTVYHSFHTLLAHKLIAPFDNPAGFPGVKYFRLSDEGEQFMQRVFDAPGARTAPSQRQMEALDG
jgi:hypothetical protein